MQEWKISAISRTSTILPVLQFRNTISLYYASVCGANAAVPSAYAICGENAVAPSAYTILYMWCKCRSPISVYYIVYHYMWCKCRSTISVYYIVYVVQILQHHQRMLYVVQMSQYHQRILYVVQMPQLHQRILYCICGANAAAPSAYSICGDIDSLQTDLGGNKNTC